MRDIEEDSEDFEEDLESLEELPESRGGSDASEMREYLLDDDSSDEVLTEDKDLLIFQQAENIVTCEIENLYKDSGTVRSKFSLKSDPPIFVIKNSFGESAQFAVTKNLAKKLEKLFGDVSLAYAGVDPSARKPIIPKGGSFKEVFTGFVKNNTFLMVIICILIVLVVLSHIL